MCARCLVCFGPITGLTVMEKRSCLIETGLTACQGLFRNRSGVPLLRIMKKKQNIMFQVNVCRTLNKSFTCFSMEVLTYSFVHGDNPFSYGTAAATMGYSSWVLLLLLLFAECCCFLPAYSIAKTRMTS